MNRNSLIPRWSVLPLLAVVIFNFSVYCGTRLFMSDAPHYSMAIPLDAYFPLLPWMVLIYLGCYLFWVVNYILATRYDRQYMARFVVADLMSKAVCLLCFLLLPATLVRPEITGTGLCDRLLRLVYSADAADNLFPSIHCLVSWLCWIGVRKNQAIPRWYRNFSLVFAVLVCLSTLMVKQHVFVDTIAGIALAESAYALAGCIFKRE